MPPRPPELHHLQLAPVDLGVIAAYLLAALAAGLWASRSAGKSGEAYFLAGRSLPGWLVGLSIVATTFAADTPLAISGMVASKGIAANWFWWSMGIAHVGMFLFWSRLWRRAEVVTDAELVELRYGGGAGRGLRVAKAIFFAGFYNAIVLGWVIRAMQKISEPFANWSAWLPAGFYAGLEARWSPDTPLGGIDETITIVALVGIATLYSTLGGLRGVVLTDLLQLLLAGIGAVYLAVCALAWLPEDGLVPSLQASLGSERAADVLAFVPSLEGLPHLTLQSFGVYLLVRWWAHPMGDGGGYIAQRLSAARSPEDAQTAAGIFVVLHYVLRPWPWIVVGLVGLVIYPPGMVWAPGPEDAALWSEGARVATDREMAYPLLAGKLLPPGLLGLLLASLLAAFMSTVDTHLNWGVSYVGNDLWRGRFRPEASEREVVLVGRVTSVIFAVAAVVVATRIDSVEAAWKFVAALGSGLGLPVLLRWIWWRANAQAEIAGALASLTVTVLLAVFGPDEMPWEYSLAAAVGAGVVASLAAILAWGPSDPATLVAFYRRVRPPGAWGPVRAQAGELAPGLPLGRLAAAWVAGALGLLAAILLPGYLLVGSHGTAALAAVLAASGWLAARHLAREPRV